MAGERIRIGILGANVTYGWGTRAHLPALAKLPDFTVHAVSNAHLETAQEASRTLGIPLAFGDYREMVAHPEVDLVVVSVRVPGHYGPVMAALEAGKHVFCEWPLGKDTAEATAMRDLAHQKGVVHMVGLQARGGPAFKQVRDLVANGYVGEVVSATMQATVSGAGVRTPLTAYLSDVTTGATTLTIQAGHSIDALRFCLGEFSAVSATVATQVKQAVVTGTDEVLDCTAPDHVLVDGQLANGAVASIAIRSVPVFGGGFHVEIHGTEGALIIDSEGSAQIGEMAVRGARRGDAGLAPIAIDEQYFAGPAFEPGPSTNVGYLYVPLLEAIRNGGRAEPDFDTAVELHRLLDAVQRASDTGTRQEI